MPFQRHAQNVTLTWCRFSFPKIWEPAPVKVKGQILGLPRFSALLVLTDESVAKIREVEAQLIKDSWPEGLPAGIKVRSCLRQGNIHRPEDPNLKDKYFISANSTPRYPSKNPDPADPAVQAAIEQARPTVYIRDAKGNLVQVSAETHRAKIYSGAAVHVAVGIFTTQLNAAEPQIDVGLNHILLTDFQAPSFGGGITGEEAFADASVDEVPPELRAELGDESVPPSDFGKAAPAPTPAKTEDDELAALGL